MEKELTISVLQDIILELRDDSVVVLKTGSYIPFPNGNEGGWFEIVVDKEYTPTGNNTFYLFLDTSYHVVARTTTGSGTTIPSSGTLAFFKTDEAKVYNIVNGVESGLLTLPFAKVTYSNGTTTIDEVYNGFGEVGNVIYALPEISCEVPYGRDSDGNPIFKTCTTQNMLFSEKLTNYPFFMGNGSIFTGIYFANSNDIYNRSSNMYYDSGNVIYGRPFNRNTVIVSPLEQSVINSGSKQLNISLPQDINLELNGGTLTLKAGSKVYVPNGSGTFDVVTISNDLSSSSSWTTNKVMLALNQNYNGMYSFVLGNQYSGSTAPSNPNAGTIWYDTTNNIIKRYSGTDWVSGISFPICVANMVSGTGFTSIDQVFNGFGYIGDCVFANPGISCEIPCGFNSDGEPVFKNCVTNRVLIEEKKTNYPFLIGNGDVFTGIYFAKSYEIYQDSSNLFYENKKAILGRPFNDMPFFVTPADLITTKLISQYANSEKILRLANGVRSIFSNAKLIKDWYNIVYNIKTAKGFGLDIWGKILNQGRNFVYTNPNTGVQTNYYLKGALTVDGTYISADEVEETYRKVLFMKAISLITNATEKSINELLQFYFEGRRVYVVQYDTMKLRYVFEAVVNKLEKSIFQSDLLPKPTGVGATFQYMPKNNYFGFYVHSRAQNDQYWTPFDNKPFYW